MSELSNQLIDNEGFISPKVVADTFHTTVKEVAELTGLSIDAVSKRERIGSKSSQKRLRDLVMIINRLTPWCGTPFQAYAWYRSEPIPSLGDATAEDLVKHGKAHLVMSYLSRIAQGGYA